MSTNSYDANKNVIESARKVKGQAGAGQFGEHARRDPEDTLEVVKTQRQMRLEILAKSRDEIFAKLEEVNNELREELHSEAWAQAPIHATTIDVDIVAASDVEVTFLAFSGLRDAEGDYIDDGSYDRDIYDQFVRAQTYDSVFEYFEETAEGSFSITIDKEATRERLDTLEQEWKDGISGRSGKQLGEDIDAAATRYLSQVAAEQSWESIELGWDEEGRTGLRAVAITAGGKRHNAGSGDLDDREAIWAAAHFTHPTAKMTPDYGSGPFTLTFDR